MGRNDEHTVEPIDSFASSAAIRNHDTGANMPELEPVVDITASQKMISAMSGSLLTSLLVTPLDVVRVRLQSQPMTIAGMNSYKFAIPAGHVGAIPTAELGVTACCREVFFAGNTAEMCLAGPRIDSLAASAATVPHDCVVEETQKKTYKSTYDGLRKIARNEGFTTLWRGLSPTLVMTIPANIIYFTGYDWLRFNKASPFSKLSSDYAPLTAGSAARILAATAVGPIELFRTRMQAAPSASRANHFLDTLTDVQNMVKTHGYTSLWRGLTLTLWRDVPFSGLYWWGYEFIRGRLTDLRQEREGRSLSRESRSDSRRRSQSAENTRDTFIDAATAGALSGAFASVVTTPFDVGKTRTQVYTDGPKRAAAAGAQAVAPEEQNMLRLLWHIFKTEGAAGLFRGWIPRMLKVSPACAIMISSYEVGKTAFRGINERARLNKPESQP